MKHVQKQQWLFMTREQAKKCDWSFWKSCNFLSRPSFHPSIHPTNNPTIHPSIAPFLPETLLEVSPNLLICSPFQWIVHMYLSWIPLRCLVWPIVSLESSLQWKKLKWSLSIQKCQRLVISPRLRFLIIMRCYTWHQKCLLLRWFPGFALRISYCA